MKDRSKLVTLVALVALVLAFASSEGNFPSLHDFGDSVFWTLLAVMVFLLIRGGCCGDASSRQRSESRGESSQHDPETSSG